MRYIVSFSPTEKSLKAMKALAGLLGGDFKEIDLSLPGERE